MHPSYNQGMNPTGGQGMDYSNQQQESRPPAGGMGPGTGPGGYYQGGPQHGGYPGMSHGGTMQQVAQQNYSQQMMMQQQQQQQFGGQAGLQGARAGYNPAFAANPPPSNIGIAQNMLSQAQASAQNAVATASVSVRQEPKKQLLPAGFPNDVLDDLSKLSVGMLCTVGKDLVHELNLRTSTLCSMLKVQSDRKQIQSSQDPQLIVEYCIMLFDKLAEIRVLIDKRSTGQEKSLKDIFDDLTDMTDPVDEKPEELRALYAVFNENKRKLTNLNGDLKLLDWMATVSDPGQLKKVDKMATSFKSENIH